MGVLSKCPPLPPKKPIPIHCDQITGKPKYVDPAHRNCVPGFKAASFTPKNKFDKYNGRTHNCIAAVTTYSGERYGYMHPHKMTGYKAGNAYGKTPLFVGLTTNNYFDHKIRKVGEEMDHAHKKLCVYDPNANRNKPRAFSHNTVGLHTFDRRNASYIRLESGDKKDLRTPLSTHRRFHVLPRSMTGLSNPGIFSGICTFPEGLGMALEPSLWGSLPEELLHLVFARLPVAGIGQLRVLSKEWKWNIDCKDSEFNQVFEASTQLKMFALMSWAAEHLVFVDLYDVQADKWHAFENNTDYLPFFDTAAFDGGLFCIPWQWRNGEGHFQIVVVNPLTQRKMQLPPLLSMGTGDPDVRVKMVQLTMDRKTKEYKLHVVGYVKTGGNGLFAQVYDSHINGWSVVESREGRILGWDQLDHSLNTKGLCVYNCADGNLQQFNPSDIAPGLTMEPDCMKLINDHLFVLHKVAPPSSTNLVQDGESISGKYCISEFHLPEKATAWVKLRVHECDPSIFDCPEEDYELALQACKGFLLVHFKAFEQEYDRVWLYNLSTCAWRNLTELEFPNFNNLLLCEISWSALP